MSAAAVASPEDANRILVYLRVRPPKPGNPEEGIPPEINPSTGATFLLDPQPDNKTVVLTDNEKSYAFDWVYDGDGPSQEEVYQRVTAPIVDNVLKGFWGTTFAYGQTGSGKSHSMMGAGPGKIEQQGIIPRALRHIFNAVSDDHQREYTIKFSYIQIYCDRLQDLFNYDSPQELKMARDKVKGFYFPDIVEHVITSEEDFRQKFTEGDKHRVVTATKMNDKSSRGHSALFIQVQSESKSDPTAEKRNGKLFLIDLAGYERFEKTGITDPKMIQEARTINASLLALGHCIQALSTGAPFIPWRDAKLTRMLEDAIGGRSKCSVLLTAGPSSEHSHETVGTLKFGQRAMSVETKASVVVEKDWKKIATLLQEKLAVAESKLNDAERVAARTQFDRLDTEARMQQELSSLKTRQHQQLTKLREEGASDEIMQRVISANETELDVVVDLQSGERDVLQDAVRKIEIERSREKQASAEEVKKLQRELETAKKESEKFEKLYNTAEEEARRVSTELKQLKVYCASVGVDAPKSAASSSTAGPASSVMFDIMKDPEARKMMEQRIAQVKDMLKEQHAAEIAERIDPLVQDRNRFKKLYEELRASVDDELQVQKDTLTGIYEQEIQEMRDSSAAIQEKLKNTHKVIKRTYQRQSEDLTAQLGRLTEQLEQQQQQQLQQQMKNSDRMSTSSSSSTKSEGLLAESHFPNPIPLLLTGYISFLVSNYGDGLGRKYQLTSAPPSFFSKLQTLLIPFGNAPVKDPETSSLNFRDACYLNFDKARLKWGMHGSILMKEAVAALAIPVRGILKLEGRSLYIACTGRGNGSAQSSVRILLDILHRHIVELCGGSSPQIFIEMALSNSVNKHEKLGEGICSYVEAMGGAETVVQEQLSCIGSMNDPAGKEIDNALKALPQWMFSDDTSK